MKGYIVIDYYDNAKHYVYNDEEMAHSKAVELVKENAPIWHDNDVYDNPEKALNGIDTYYDLQGCTCVEIIDCEIFLKAKQDKEQLEAK